MAHRSGFVTVLGRPNVGKSTLVNQAVGRKVSIVTDKPQTTRSRILGVCHRPACQIVLVDTPGIHKPQHEMNRRMVEISFAEAAANDACLVILDASEGLGLGDRFVIHRAVATGKPLVLCMNKVDLVAKPLLLPLLDLCKELAPWHAMVPVSALSGENVDALMACLEELSPEGPPLFPGDVSSDQPEAVLVAELVREQLTILTRDEIPSSSAVTIERWEERQEANPLTVIAATIWVEREGQKGIVVGKGGRMIRDIGKLARAQVEPLLGRHVFLDLRVKVRSAWREDASFLERFLPAR